jgi:hypothetical protein
MWLRNWSGRGAISIGGFAVVVEIAKGAAPDFCPSPQTSITAADDRMGSNALGYCPGCIFDMKLY